MNSMHTEDLFYEREPKREFAIGMEVVGLNMLLVMDFRSLSSLLASSLLPSSRRNPFPYFHGYFFRSCQDLKFLDGRGMAVTDGTAAQRHRAARCPNGTIQKFPRLRSQEGVWINLANTYGGAGADSAKRQPAPIFDTSR